ncbi:MAG: PilN domain-containing protein [Bacillota bacterium]|nr:PilN domain-containing protein [Bacillota bacterium]
MVEHISLLPPEIKAARQLQQKLKKILFVLLIILLIVALVALFFFVSSFLVRQDLNSLQAEKEMIEKQSEELVEYENLYNNLTARRNLVGQAMGTIPNWSVLLSDTAAVLPAGSWMQDMTFVYSEENGSMTMRGWAYTHSGVAAMLEKMDSLEQLAEVQCRTSNDTDFEGQEVVQFQVESGLLTGSPFIVSEEEGE